MERQRQLRIVPDVRTQSVDEQSSDAVTWARDWGMLLRTARQVAGLSLMDLSERTGLSKGYLSKLESSREGARNPSRATLVALARALPSFRPLAYTLEPTQPLDTAFDVHMQALAEAPLRRPSAFLIGQGVEQGERGAAEPIQLGWRELELLVALLALERSAQAHPLTARMIARAVDRPTESVTPVLERLASDGVLHCYPPMRPGGSPTYACDEALEQRIGLSRVGDALTLAAALLAQGPLQRTRADSQARPAGRPRGRRMPLDEKLDEEEYDSD